jgi:aspartate/methionine/tyrosine aminotransferase
MRLAERMNRLGTETAFAVSERARAFAAEGNRVYPFHLGDLNLPTPQNIVEASLKAIREGKTGYCSSPGIMELRSALAADINASHGTSYSAENVAIQPGGKPVIGKFMLALVNPGDGVLYPNPGYPIYESQIEFHDGQALPYGLIERADTFQLDWDGLSGGLGPGTRFLVLNDLQNPTGAECSRAELQRIANLVLEHNLFVLCDEAYFDIRYEGQSRSLVSFPGLEDRCVILYTFSKKFAMTGWRLGAAIGPKEIISAIAKLSVNAESCSNHFVQHGALEGLTGDQSGPKKILAILKERRDVAADMLNSIKGVRCHRPNATFYLFPNVTEAMARKGISGYREFAEAVLQNTGVSFCTRAHFGRPGPNEKEYYIRLAYSGINTDQIREGLGKLKSYLES